MPPVQYEPPGQGAQPLPVQYCPAVHAMVHTLLVVTVQGVVSMYPGSHAGEQAVQTLLVVGVQAVVS